MIDFCRFLNRRCLATKLHAINFELGEKNSVASFLHGSDTVRILHKNLRFLAAKNRITKDYDISLDFDE
jgi:hypothetical protein